jgi:LPS sulfotransferase NodH
MFHAFAGLTDMAPVRFVIITAGRTGSTWLRLLLDSHPAVNCHGEVFGTNLSSIAAPDTADWDAALAAREAAPTVFLHQRVFASTAAQAVGFKVLYHHLIERWPTVLRSLVADRSIRIIHLTRRDGLKRFLSEYFVGTVTHRHQLPAGETPPLVSPVHIAVTDVLGSLQRVAEQQAAMRAHFAHHPVFDIDYEDFTAPDSPVLDVLLDFLAVTRAPLRADLQKILPDDVSALIENLDEVRAALAASPFADQALSLP